MASSNLTRYAWLSIAAAVITLSLKTVAYLVTDSVGMLSDAMESIVNLAAAINKILDKALGIINNCRKTCR